ncbi:MAG TPA: ABC transporter permease [Chloroflexota bacterium]|nr:ABC transporter permease [Chloroflexota bacterium]
MAVEARPLSHAPTADFVPARAAKIIRETPFVPSLVLGLLLLTAVFAGVLAPHDPTLPIAGPGAGVFAPPYWMAGGSLNTPLGTDFQGRDVLSRLIYGARVTLMVAVMGTAVAGGIGMLLGIIAGYFGGWVDNAIMRLTDTWLALPSLVFAIFLAALLQDKINQITFFLPPGVGNIIIVFGLIYWTRYARVIRGEVLTLRERDYVRLAQVAGLSKTRIIIRHIVPNVLNTWMVLASLTVGVVIISEASLSFLGLGVQAPTPAWGNMLSEARRTLMAGQWWLTVLPGICISVVVLAANLFGDWMRVRLDPKQRNL